MKLEFNGQTWYASCVICKEMVPVRNTYCLRLLQDFRCSKCAETHPQPEWPGWSANHKTTTRFTIAGKRIK